VSAGPPTATPRDRAVVGSLVLVLALVGAAIVAPGLSRAGPTPGTGAGPTPTRGPLESAPPGRPIRYGIVGEPSAVNPLFATNRADESLVALVFSGLVRLGPDDALEPDLASDWAMAEDGRSWTFRIRADARWHDGRPVTADDVAFTVNLLRDPASTGPAAGSWRAVTATVVDPETVRFELESPIGGFLELARQPILPAHLLADVPPGELATHSFNRMPIGSGPYRLVSLDATRAVLAPAATLRAPRPTPSPAASPDPADPEATLPRPAIAPPADEPAELEVRFHADAAALAEAMAAGELDAAAGLPPEEAIRLASTPSTRLLRYPTATLTAVLFNLRPSHPEFRDARVRAALLRAIDRRGLVGDAWAGQATVAAAPIPATSPFFDSTVSRPIGYDPAAARRALVDADWEALDPGLAAPGEDAPFAFELLSPDVAANTASFTAAARIAADWDALGLDVTPVALPPEQLVADRLRGGDFDAAVVDINIGLDPDLYPLLGSTQGTSRGLNLSGLVDRDLDELLVKAREPGTDEVRRQAYRALQERLAARQYLLPIAFHDELVVVRDTLTGARPRQVGTVGDSFWDVLSWRLADDR
jgi:peptide/nickel transport system substrate-binding protein